MPLEKILKGLRYPELSIVIPILVGGFCITYIALNALFIFSNETEKTIRQELNLMREQTHLLASISHLSEHSQAGELPLGIQTILADPKVEWLAFVAPDGSLITSSPRKSGELPDLNRIPPQLQREFQSAMQTKIAHSDYDGERFARVILPEPTESTPRWAVLLEKDITDSLNAALKYTFMDAGRSAIVNLLGCFLLCWVLQRYLSQRVNQLIRESNLLTQFPDEETDNPNGDEFDRISKLLHQSNRRLHAIASSIPDVFYVISINLDRTFYISPAYKEIWGPNAYDPENPNTNWLNLVIPEDQPSIKTALHRIQNGDTHFEVEFRTHWNKTDEIRWLYTRAFPVKSATGKIEFLVGFTRDVTKQKQLEEEVLNISETERRNIGHDLHDDLCQRLAAIRLRSEILTDQLSKKCLPEAVSAEDISKKIGGAVELCRNLALGLSPVNIENEGLMHALEILAETSSSIHQIPCKFFCPDTILVRNNASATHLYRITQELVNNAARHAKPSYIQIQLLKKDSGIQLEIEHDGIFFSPNTVAEHRGMGLRILRYRTKALGSNLYFEPRPNNQPGTQVSLLVSELYC